MDFSNVFFLRIIFLAFFSFYISACCGVNACWRCCERRVAPLVIKPKDLPTQYDYLAPDGSEIRRLQTKENARNGDLAHCKLSPGKISCAVKHKTVEELWYVTDGTGEIWIKPENQEGKIFQMKKGTALSIPVGTSFQFRNTSQTAPLEIVIITMPPWPNAREAIPVKGEW